MSTRLERGERVLARVPDWLGDLVMAEPALRALHARTRELGGTFTLVGKPHLLSVFGDAFGGCERRDARETSSWRGHDVAVLFTNSFRSAWTARMAGIPRRFGWERDFRAWLLSDSWTPAFERGGTPVRLGIRGRGSRYLPRPFGSTCVELVHWLGIPVHDPRPRLEATNAARESVNARLASAGIAPQERFTLVNAGGRPGSAKSYPAELWGRALALRDERLVLVCGPGEEDALREILRAVPRATALLEPVASLPELVALCERASLVLTADSGPRHVAAAVGARLVVLCGPTDPRHTADHTTSTRILRTPVPCGPCHKERCPLTGAAELACMRRIDPQEVGSAK